MKNRTMEAMQNFEPKDTPRVSVNTLKVGSINYGVKDLVTADVIATALDKNLEEFEKARKIDPKTMEIFAFVTGPLRGYADDHPEASFEIETELFKVFSHEALKKYNIKH